MPGRKLAAFFTDAAVNDGAATNWNQLSRTGPEKRSETS
jgi:hypothetical protein